MRVLVSSIRLTIWPVSVRSLPETPEIDNTMTCSLFAFMDRKIFRRQLPLFPSAIAETLNIFLRISYPPLKALKNRAISPVSPLPVRKAIIASTFLLRVLGLDFFLTNQILPSTPETNFVRIGENEFDRCSVNFTNRSLFFLLQKNMAWIVTRFQGLLPCDVYTACKDFVPEFLVISVILTYFIYSFFFLRPFFIRRFRAWTDAEFVLYSLLMIVLTGLWFILSEVFDSGSELFCSI